ncbi:MAG: hypothetical protein IJ587_04545 [Synergistaceae bacterium]|nr:hypothetical protein [Synergistaceae bacterium]
MQKFTDAPADDAEEATGEAATDFTEEESVPAEIQEMSALSEYIDEQLFRTNPRRPSKTPLP